MTEQEICKACATGNSKHKHNQDSKTCRYGRLAYLQSLPEEQQVEALRAEERLAKPMAEFIVQMAKERNTSVLAVMEEEKVV